MVLRLGELEEGRTAVLRGCLMPPDARTELERLGLVAGTEIRCKRRLRRGKTAVYAFYDTVLALRDADACRFVCES